jgi:hypothetical protein
VFVLRNATRLPSFHHPVLSEFYHIIYIPGDPLPWHYKYEHAAVTTDCVIFTYKVKESEDSPVYLYEQPDN